jgi:hypothetical protein
MNGVNPKASIVPFVCWSKVVQFLVRFVIQSGQILHQDLIGPVSANLVLEGLKQAIVSMR